jgi:hypothetical protein
LSYWKATPLFGIQKTERTTKAWYQMPDLGTKDDYQFFSRCRAFVNLDKYYGKDNEFGSSLGSF